MAETLKTTRYGLQGLKTSLHPSRYPVNVRKKGTGLQYLASASIGVSASTFTFSIPATTYRGVKANRIAVVGFAFMGTASPSAITSVSVNGLVIPAAECSVAMYDTDGATWRSLVAAIWFPLPKGGAVSVIVNVNSGPSAVSAGGVNFYEMVSPVLAPDIRSVAGPVALVKGKSNALVIASAVGSLGGANPKAISGLEVRGDYVSSRVLVDGLAQNLPRTVAFKSEAANISDVNMRLLSWR